MQSKEVIKTVKKDKKTYSAITGECVVYKQNTVLKGKR